MNLLHQRRLLKSEVLEQPGTTEVPLIANQEVAITAKTPMTSPSSVNEVNPDLIRTPTSDLDLMLNKAKTYSESYSRSISEFSESLTSPALYKLSEETKNEVKSFFRMLELPLAEIATDHIPAFTGCVRHLISKKILPRSEHVKLEEFGSNLSENLIIATCCQKEMKEKYDAMNQFANVLKKLDTMGNNIHQLKDELQQIDLEEARLLARLDQLRKQRKFLLAQKELINHELANVTYDEQGTKAVITMAKTDFLKYQERFNAINNRWSYFSKLFMEFK